MRIKWAKCRGTLLSSWRNQSRSPVVWRAPALSCSPRPLAQVTPRQESGKPIGLGPGSGPVPSTKLALQKAGMKLDDMDLIEVNEAFAAQYLAVEKELGLDRSKVNVNGGAIALGHPLGATGTRLVITVLLELRRRTGRYGLSTACLGGGQGIAVIVECLQ